jgi:hypothetical protein
VVVRIHRRGSANAALAQSAERLHGKEKVNGSIPLGGSGVIHMSDLKFLDLITLSDEQISDILNPIGCDLVSLSDSKFNSSV